MSSNLSEINTLLRNQPFSHIYIRSLDRKITKAKVLAEKSIKQWNEFLVGNFEIPSLELEETELEIETTWKHQCKTYILPLTYWHKLLMI